MSKLLYEAETYEIRGAAMRVHAELGSGFLEAVYQEAMEIESELGNLPFVGEPRLRIRYRDRFLRKEYIPDFLFYDKVVVELKCIKQITDIERAIAHNYLKATGYRLALIINFSPTGNLEIERVIR
jgi:GxxExxY protein